MRTVALALLFACAAPVAAQKPQGPQPQPPQGPQAPGQDVFGRYLFPPELIMRRQQEIGLTDAQRDQIRGEVQRAQGAFTDVQWQLAGQTEKIERLLQAPTIDEGRVLAQVDSVLALERTIKRTQMALLIRIHNALTEPQRARLLELRAAP